MKSVKTGGNQEISYPVSPGLPGLIDDQNRRVGNDFGGDTYYSINQSNRPSLSSFNLRRSMQEVLSIEEQERLSYENHNTFNMNYGNPMNQTVFQVNTRPFQSDSTENFLVDPFMSDSRQSFSQRNHLSFSHPIISTPPFLELREKASSIDWSRSGITLDEKLEPADHRHVESPVFGPFMPMSHSPLPYIKEGVEERRSNMSDIELKMMSTSPPPPSLIAMQPLPQAKLSPIVQISQEDKTRIKKERNKESARLSRKRKKQYQKDLDMTIAEKIEELNQEREHQLQLIQSSHESVISNLVITLSQDPMAYQQLVEFVGPKSSEARDGSTFLWTELMSLCCPFYQNFITWILSRGSQFFSRFGECIESSSGSKEIPKDSFHKPSDFSGPYSFWPKFISHFDLSPEQEAKLRQTFINESQKHAVVSPKTKVNKPSVQIEKTTSLLNKLQTLSSRIDDEMDEVYQSVIATLTPQQFVAALQFMRSQNLENTDFYALLSRIEMELPNQQRLNKSPVLCSPSVEMGIDKMLEILNSVE